MKKNKKVRKKEFNITQNACYIYGKRRNTYVQRYYSIYLDLYFLL